MFINLMIFSAIIVAFLMAVLSIKKVFGDDDGFQNMTCLSSDDNEELGSCAVCDIKDIANCDVPKDKLSRTDQK